MNATMSLDNMKHDPVMLDQIISIISPQHGGTFIDCTFGGGGYSKEILKYSNTQVLAIDRDQTTFKHAKILKDKFANRFKFFINKFSNLNEIANKQPKAIIFDLGMSSFQLSDNERGFSFKSTGPLNMEMGINNFSAYQAINFLDNKSLTDIIKILGEEKDAKKIVNKIIYHRAKKKINTSKELSLIIRNAKKNYKGSKIDPATKTFQAIRIFVNKELTELMSGLIAAARLLENGGVLAVITFHSLEDKIVKYFFNLCSNLKKNPSRYLPVDSNQTNLFHLSQKKPLTPSNKEIIKNYRSRSAKLRFGIRNNNPFVLPNEFLKKFEKYSKLESINL